MSKAKEKGTAFEAACCRFLNFKGVAAVRNALSGALDVGDISFTVGGRKYCIEAKNQKRLAIPAWFRELEREQENAGADGGALWCHRDGCGPTNFHKTYVVITAGEYVELLMRSASESEKS